ncbi:dihydrofolate reductase [Actinoplanes sp. OR16]|uniref:NAD(P)-dependent oxidoreductase n=1 Tax=Actinoplanes sp. OR16 TaxID=946334 RepID=UPI000F6C5D7F|nr:NAD(P)-dependent oxidoreductase [Actinoplanes sp. OR16]BBH67855.1 dihydrofolate reductase [Actinoplanes sp. OR16]
MSTPVDEPLPVAVLPRPAPAVVDGIAAGGGRPVPPEQAGSLIWTGDGPDGLAAALAELPRVRWVQLPAAGVDGYLPLIDDDRIWTRASGVFDTPVAEHALMLAMAVLRDVTGSVRPRRWRPRPPVSLVGADVLVVGGGGITTALLGLLAPWRTHTTVVNRTGRPVPGADAVVPIDRLDEVLPAARVVVLAAPLTARTDGLIDARRLRLMRPDACLVNVARGRLVVTDDLVSALSTGEIAGAGLDVTEPEPLPDDHPLWDLPTCLITAHCAGELDDSMAEFAALVAGNVRRRAAGRPLSGLIDTAAGY